MSRTIRDLTPYKFKLANLDLKNRKRLRRACRKEPSKVKRGRVKDYQSRLDSLLDINELEESGVKYVGKGLSRPRKGQLSQSTYKFVSAIEELPRNISKYK